jgi:hypothetical protein
MSDLLRSLIPDSNRLEAAFARSSNGSHKGNLLAAAYDAGFLGAFVDDENQPDWARRAARYLDDEFMHDSPGKIKLFGDVTPMLGDGDGECHINCRHALELWHKGGEVGPKPFTSYQDYGSCVDCSKAEGCTGLFAWRVAQGGFNETFLFPDAWYNYADRGYCNDGWTGGGIATVARRFGCAFRTQYKLAGGEIDFTDDDVNEKICARQWCRTGAPQWLHDHTMANHAFDDGAITKFQGSKAEVKKAMKAGAFLHHGGTRTSGGPKPFTIGSTGPHMQTTCGYDDTDEARKFFRDKGFSIADDDFPVVNHQTWGPQWRGETADEYWPSWWGPKPEGAWIWRASDMLSRIGFEYVWLPWVKGFPATGPGPSPLHPPLSGDVYVEQAGQVFAVRGELELNLPANQPAGKYPFIIVPDGQGKYRAIAKPVL